MVDRSTTRPGAGPRARHQRHHLCRAGTGACDLRSAGRRHRPDAVDGSPRSDPHFFSRARPFCATGQPAVARATVCPTSSSARKRWWAKGEVYSNTAWIRRRGIAPFPRLVEDVREERLLAVCTRRRILAPVHRLSNVLGGDPFQRRRRCVKAAAHNPPATGSPASDCELARPGRSARP